jgi:hypothetical protein
MHNFKTGDAVLIECEGRRVPGEVVFASGNGVSLMLGFEAVLAGHVGMMPVLRDDKGAYQSIMTGHAVALSVR